MFIGEILDIHGHIRVDAGISHVFTNISEENLHLLLRVAMGARQGCNCHGFCGIDKIVKVPLANLLIVGILWPGIRGPLEALEDNVLEPGLGHHPLHQRHGYKFPTKFHTSLSNEGGKLGQWFLWGQGIVICREDEVTLLDFEVTARLGESGSRISHNTC